MVFVWDVFIKDFIPIPELKLLVMIVGALSGFFGVLSFFFDKKFFSVERGVISELKPEGIKDYESLNDALASIFQGKQIIHKVKIFAYSAKNYIEFFSRSDGVIIEELDLCLHRANDYTAWFCKSQINVERYITELDTTLNTLEGLKGKGRIKKFQIGFYDFESYSHFGLFDNQMICGDLTPIFNEANKVKVGMTKLILDTGDNELLFRGKEAFFDELFNNLISDSGLKTQKKEDCKYCQAISLILDPRHENGTSEGGICDISLLPEPSKMKDFILEPDFYPISELHMLLVSTFHILNLYEYLKHKDAVNELEKIIQIISETVREEEGNRDILVFEHGTAIDGSPISSSSIEHLHLHIIYKPWFDYKKAIQADNAGRKEGKKLYDVNNGMRKYTTLQSFAEDSSLRRRDYFMIWDPQEGDITVWLPIVGESQFLRRIFFNGLSSAERGNLYGDKNASYDWKEEVFDYPRKMLDFHLSLGEKIYRRIVENNNGRN